MEKPDKPLEIAFHNLQPSEAVEAEIRTRFDKLNRLYDRLEYARVSVEALHQQHQTGNLYEVHIRLGVPGQDLVVSREPHRAKQRYAQPDVYTSVRDAFKAAERQLKEFKRKLRGEVKPHDTDALMHGEVAELHPDQDHGFVVTTTGTQLYFHRNSVLGAGFDRLKRGDAVHYVETDGDTGPIASKVWQAAEESME